MFGEILHFYNRDKETIFRFEIKFHFLGTAGEIKRKILKYVDGTVPEIKTSSSFYSRRSSDDVSSKTDFENDAMVITSRIENNIVSNSTLQYQIKKNSLESVHSSESDHQFSVPASRKNLETDKQLGTLLMFKDLKTCGRYNVQFVNEDETHTRRGSQYDSETGTNTISSTNSITSSPSKLERVHAMKTDSPTMEVDTVICKENGKTAEKQKFVDCFLAKNNENSSNECEMMLQFKIVNNKILLRTSNTEWRQLTVEMADKELPSVVKPIEGQSIVFQVLLKHLPNFNHRPNK